MAAGIRAKEDKLNLLRYGAWLQWRNLKYTGTHSLKYIPDQSILHIFSETLLLI